MSADAARARKNRCGLFLLRNQFALIEALENDHFVHAIQEFRAEML